MNKYEKQLVLENYKLWNAISEINKEYTKYEFDKIKCNEFRRYEKQTSASKYSNISIYDFNIDDMSENTKYFNYGKFLIEKILEEKDEYFKIISKYSKIYSIYCEYLNKVNETFEELRIYKKYVEPIVKYRSKISKFFQSDEDFKISKMKEFYEKYHYEKAILQEKIFNPIFPFVVLKLSASSPWNYYEDEQIYSFMNIFSCYLQAEKKQGERTFIQQQRALISDDIRYDVLKRDNFRCKICGATANDGVKLEVDHIIPVSKGGKSTMDNLQTLCERCNHGKRDKI